MSEYLDKTGLAYLWGKIKGKLNIMTNELSSVSERIANIEDSNLDKEAILEENVDFICPKDGYFMIHTGLTNAGNNKCIYMYINSYSVNNHIINQYEYAITSVFVKKGGVIKYRCGSAITNDEKSHILVTFRYSNK